MEFSSIFNRIEIERLNDVNDEKSKLLKKQYN